jgi:undecaprenyl-diphosphatase
VTNEAALPSGQLPSGQLPITGSRPERATLTLAVRLIGAALLILLALVALGELLTHAWQHSGLVRWDGSVERWFVHRRTSGWNAVTKAMTFGAETETVIGIGLVFFVVLRWRLGRWLESMFLAICLIGEVSIFLCTTLLVDRQRPAVPRLDGAPPTSSFPSGHTAASVALYGGLALIAWHAARAAWLRTVATALAVLMPVGVGLCRLYRGMHNPTDVLAGALFASCWLAIVSVLVLHGDRRPAR